MPLRNAVLIIVTVLIAGTVAHAQKADAEVTVNQRPFVDLARMINDLVDKKQLDLESPFFVSGSGKVANGRFDPKSFKITRSESDDPNMRVVVTEAIKAFDSSGYLEYLTMSGVSDLNFTLQQDGKKDTALIESQFNNDYRPKSIASMLSLFINMQTEAKQRPEATQDDKDDLVLLQNSSVTATGNKLDIALTLPKGEAQRMLQRKLAEQRSQNVK